MARIVDEAGGDRRERPDAELENARLGRLLEQAVDRLPEPFRVVFVLRAVEGLSVRETSQILDLNEKTVKTRLFRARRLLRSELERRFTESGVRLYEFAGSRCDRLTAEVMARVVRQANHEA